MPKVIQYLLLALGALAMLVVINWARQELVVGIVAACLLIVAAMIPSLLKSKAGEDEGSPPTG